MTHGACHPGRPPFIAVLRGYDTRFNPAKREPGVGTATRMVVVEAVA
jgi:hypothetical protein